MSWLSRCLVELSSGAGTAGAGLSRAPRRRAWCRAPTRGDLWQRHAWLGHRKGQHALLQLWRDDAAVDKGLPSHKTLVLQRRLRLQAGGAAGSRALSPNGYTERSCCGPSWARAWGRLS
jgi:hypothetical protein